MLKNTKIMLQKDPRLCKLDISSETITHETITHETIN